MASKLTPTAEPKAYIERFVEGRIAPFSQKHPVLGKILCPLPTTLLALIEATLRVALASITLVAYPFGLGFKKGGFQFAERGVTLYHQNLKMVLGSLGVIFKKHRRSPLSSKPPIEFLSNNAYKDEGFLFRFKRDNPIVKTLPSLRAQQSVKLPGRGA